MLSTSILVRESDKKEFRVTSHGHWSDIIACDGSGETDLVKLAWGSVGAKDPEYFVSNRKEHSYLVKPAMNPDPELYCNNFFNVFMYNDMMDDAIDYGLVYDHVYIMRDIETLSGLKLIQGDTFHQMNLDFLRASFSFIDWESAEKCADGFTIMPTRHILIPQVELAPFLKW